MSFIKYPLTAVCALVIFLAAGTRCGFGIEPSAEAALLRGDWGKLLDLLDDRGSGSSDPVVTHLLAHAYSAVGRGLKSDSLFSSMRGQDKRIWLEWADSLERAHPSSFVAVYLSADARYRAGRWAEAISGYSGALGLMEDNYALISKARGAAWAERKRDSAAIADFTVALKADPNDVLTRYRRARAYASAGSYDDAVVDFDAALRLNRNFMLARYYRAVALGDAGRIDDAIAAFRSFINHPSTDESRYIALAEEQIDKLERAVALGDSLLAGLVSDTAKAGMAVVIDSVEFLESARQVMAVDAQPVPKSVPVPDYPESAAAAEITGTVEIRVLVGEEGQILSVMPDERTSVDPILIEAALSAAREGEWEPAMQEKKPIPFWVEYKTEFAEGGEVRNLLPERGKESGGEGDSAIARTPPQPIFLPEPEYPDSAVEAGITGVLQVKALINAAGNVQDVVILRKSAASAVFEEATKVSAREGNWLPATDNGIPVPCWVVYTVSFSPEHLEREKLLMLAHKAATVDSSAVSVPDSTIAVADSSEVLPAPDETVDADREPAPIHLAQPRYPQTARPDSLETTVKVKVLVDRNGSVRDAIIQESPIQGKGFEEAALEAAAKGKWRPAEKDGRPIACWVSSEVRFSPSATLAEQGPQRAAPPGPESQPQTEDKKDTVGTSTAAEPVTAAGSRSSTDQMPEPVDIPPAVFPEDALASGLAGVVEVKVLVNRDGTVRRAVVTTDSGTHPGFEDAAREAALKGIWKPAIIGGKELPFQMTYQVEFTADGRVVNHFESESKPDMEPVTRPPAEPDSAKGVQAETKDAPATGRDSMDTGVTEAELLPGPDDLVEVDDQPTATFQAKPDYPASAREAAVEADVWVRVLIDKNGLVRDVVVERTSVEGMGFEEKAREAAHKGRWTPAKLKGEPIAVWVSYKIRFALD